MISYVSGSGRDAFCELDGANAADVLFKVCFLVARHLKQCEKQRLFEELRLFGNDFYYGYHDGVL